MDYQFNITTSSKTVINFALVFFWIALPLIVYIFLASLLALIAGQAVVNRAIIGLIASALGFFLVITFPLQIVNQFNRIRVTTEGLYVEVYVLRYIWKFVEWKDVLDLRLLPKLDRWGQPQWLITVRKLTYWHRWISWQYNALSQPGILISSDLIDREKLLRLIKDKVR
jgi:hypothetical protein